MSPLVTVTFNQGIHIGKVCVQRDFTKLNVECKKGCLRNVGSLYAILSIHYPKDFTHVKKKVVSVNLLLTLMGYVEDGRIIENSDLTKVSASDT